MSMEVLTRGVLALGIGLIVFRVVLWAAQQVTQAVQPKFDALALALLFGAFGAGAIYVSIGNAEVQGLTRFIGQYFADAPVLKGLFLFVLLCIGVQVWRSPKDAVDDEEVWS